MNEAAASVRLIGLAYEAAFDRDSWSVLLDELRQHLGAESGLLRLYGERCTELHLNLTVGFDPAYQRLYQERFVCDDPVRDRVAELPPGQMVRGDDIIPFQSLRRTPFYLEYMRPQGKRHLIGGPLLRESDLVAILGVQRREDQGEFAHDREQWLSSISEHIQRALRLYLQTARLEARCRALSSLLDTIPTAVFGVDGYGHVLLMNAPAEQLILDGSLLYLRNSYLHAHRPDCERQLRKQIRSALGTTSEDADRRACGGSLSHPCDGSPFGVLAVPWTDPIPNDIGSGRGLSALVLVGPGQLEDPGSADLVASLLQLTRAEARIVVALVSCGTLEAAAERSGVRIETARSYVKSALRKTGCRRQGELVRTVLRTPAAQFSGLGASG